MRDERGLIGLGVFRLVFGLVLVATIGYEAGAVAFARVQAEEVAALAAGEAAGTWRDSGSYDASVKRAIEVIAERDPNARLIRTSLEIQGGRVTLTVVKRARTYLIQHIGFLEGFHTARGTATGVPPLV